MYNGYTVQSTEQKHDWSIYDAHHGFVYYWPYDSIPICMLGSMEVCETGLQIKERKYSRGAVAAVSVLFFFGVMFGFYVIAPWMVYFLANYSISDMVVNEFDITSYVSTVVMLVFGSGLLFQLPVVIYFLTKVGIVTPEFLRKYRKHSIIIILIVAAIVTPPDPIEPNADHNSAVSAF